MFVFFIFIAALSTSLNAKPWHLENSIQNKNAAPASIQSLSIIPGPYKVVVAVIDSGVLASHPALDDRLLPGVDMQSPPLNLRGERSTNFEPEDPDLKCKNKTVSSAYRTHGTEVSSVIAGNGKLGVYGVNPDAFIVPIRIAGPCRIARRDMMDAIKWAIGEEVVGLPINKNPAHIINMSFSGGKGRCHPEMQELIRKVVSKNIFVVAAAGNNFKKHLEEPANCDGVISVGALNAKNFIESYSALDERTTIFAPGGGKRMNVPFDWASNKILVATEMENTLGRRKMTSDYSGMGTSFAAPIVSGFIALQLSHNKNFKVTDFHEDLPKFTRDLMVDNKVNFRVLGLNANSSGIEHEN